MVVEACTIDAIKEVEAGIEKLAAVCTTPKLARQLTEISRTFKKLKKNLISLYSLERCDKYCGHDINYCHCPKIARMPAETNAKWDKLTADKTERA